MLRLPVLLELHWNKKMNGEDVWIALQNLTKESKYYWNCFSCGGYMYETLEEFLKRVFKQSKSQFNTVCKSCKSVDNIKSDKEYLSSIVISKDLKEYLSLHRDLQFNTVVFKCPVCGKYKYSTKTTMFFKYKSLICSDCISLESKKVLTNKTMDLLFPGVGDYWGKNFLPYNKTVPIIYKQQFNLICPVCGKNHSKSYSAIERSGVMCEQCARTKNRVRNIGSLFDNYPVLAEMWDRGNNHKSSKEILPSSTMVGKFVCIEGGVPHSFVRQVSVIRSAFDKGSNGCPVCANRELYTGINDFATKFPKAAGYWDYNNNEFPPEKSLVTNQTKFAMICPRCGKKHTKRSDGVERNGAYCEKCAAVKNKLSEDNSLFINYPVAAEMWDNGENSIRSKELTVSSQVIGNFMCPGGKYQGKPHVFIRSVASVVNSIKNGSEYNGCSVCAGFAVATGVNDFRTMCPNVSKLWDYSRNTDEPEDIYYLSEKKYSFICPQGHNYFKDLLHMARSEKLGATGCPVCKGKEVRPGVNDVATTHKHMMKYWDYKINEIDPTTVSAGSNKIIKSHCRFCGNVYETSVFNWVNGLVVSCPNCRKRQYSASEKELCEEIRSWGIEVRENVHLTGDGRTYDMYIPSKKVAIEYNGLYYHSDVIRPDKDYHFKKCSDCLEVGIELIQIWEDDYTSRRDIVLRLLKSKLGVSDLRKVNARDCSVFIPQKNEIRPFLEENHIQGYVSGSKYIGLYTRKDELVAMMVLEWHKDNKDLLIKRYVTSCNVRGGFSKILSLLKEEYPEATGVYTFSDNTISFGDLYKSNGFRSVAFIEPDYSYLVNNSRVHKFNYRKSRFMSDPNLYYEEGMTEAELAYANGIPRVYDAGKIRWYKEL